MVVVGAAQGIGRVTAELFAKEGATVVATDVKPTVREVFAELRSRDHPRPARLLDGPRRHRPGRPASGAGRRATVDEFGQIDVLAHIAGVVQTAGLAEDLDVAEWDRVMSVNLKGRS